MAKRTANPRAKAMQVPEITVGVYPSVCVLIMDFLSPAWMAALQPHAKGHWRGKHTATARLREAVRLACCDALARKGYQYQTATIRYRFFYPNDIQRDEANMIQRLKPVVDGIVSSGLLPGDHWQVLKTAGVESAIDKQRPRIEVVISRAEGGE